MQISVVIHKCLALILQEFWWESGEKWVKIQMMLNPFYANVPILYSLKTSENSGIFRVYKMGTLAQDELILRYLCHVF